MDFARNRHLGDGGGKTPPRRMPPSGTPGFPASRAVARVAPTLLAACLVVGVLGCATGAGLTRDQVIEQVGSLGALATQLNAATGEGLDALAPKGFASAQQLLDEAVSTAQDGDNANAERLAQDGLARLERARSESRRTSETLREVLLRRQRAIEAGAPSLLSERFGGLEAELRDAARLAERGDVEGAKEARPALLRGYSSLELDALKTGATDLARIAIEEAREAGADRYAPDTFSRATKELSVAEGILETDRSRTDESNEHARRAADFATRSRFLSELVKDFDRRDYDREAVLLWYQEQLAELTSPLDEGISYAKPNYEAIAEVRDRIATAVRGRKQAEAQLAEATARIGALEVSKTTSREELETRLAQLQSAQQAAEARYERVSSMFSEDEALVYRRGGDVLLTTYGFDFPVGESEIRSGNFGLLNKIARAISEFDRPKVVVSGHTDATGSDTMNQKLSEERAKKVGAFLVQVGELSPARVATQGYGESKPVASNETSEGRARNRRIEILIVNDAGAASGLPAVSSPPPGR